MARPSIQLNAKGRLEIHGDLSFASVPELWRQCCARFADRDTLDIDLRGVQRSDSAPDRRRRNGRTERT